MKTLQVASYRSESSHPKIDETLQAGENERSLVERNLLLRDDCVTWSLSSWCHVNASAHYHHSILRLLLHGGENGIELEARLGPGVRQAQGLVQKPQKLHSMVWPPVWPVWLKN